MSFKKTYDVTDAINYYLSTDEVKIPIIFEKYEITITTTLDAINAIKTFDGMRSGDIGMSDVELANIKGIHNDVTYTIKYLVGKYQRTPPTEPTDYESYRIGRTPVDFFENSKSSSVNVIGNTWFPMIIFENGSEYSLAATSIMKGFIGFKRTKSSHYEIDTGALPYGVGYMQLTLDAKTVAKALVMSEFDVIHFTK